MSNKIKSLSAEEQLNLRNRARDELLRLENVFNDAAAKQIVDDFKDYFSVCEIVYKVILEDHQFNKTGKHKEHLTVSMVEAPHALKYAGYDFDKNLLTRLFGAEEKIGSRSVKKLRDSLTHSLNEKAVKELQDRHDELYGYMRDFLSKIREVDMEIVN